MYVSRGIAEPSHTTVIIETQQCVPLCIFIDLNVNKISSVATETQQCVPFALLSSYKIFRIAVNNRNLLRSSCKVYYILVGLKKMDFSDTFFVKVSNTKRHENSSSGSSAGTCGQP